MAVKAFISHASEDKSRFVEPFATALRSLGIDAWVDRWEMEPGDSLVDRIFEEGIKQAEAFIIVLSSHSIDKPWVREELNAAFVARIEKNTRLIPVVIEACQVPECLKSTVWEHVADVGDAEEHARKIANTLLGLSDKPPLGETPGHVSTVIDAFPEFTKQDSLTLQRACELSMTDDPTVDFQQLVTSLASDGLTQDEVEESIEVLNRQGYLEAETGVSVGIFFVRIPDFVFDQFLAATQPDYGDTVRNVCLAFHNHGHTELESIIEFTGHTERVVRHVLVYLDHQGLATVRSGVGGWMSVVSLSPELKRQLREAS